MLFVAVLVLAARGSLPFYSNGFMEVIYSSPELLVSSDSRFISLYQLCGAGISCTLITGYPTYRLSERIGPKYTATLGFLLNIIAYICLRRPTFKRGYLSVCLFGISTSCLVNSHAEVAYLFPGNFSTVLTLVG